MHWPWWFFVLAFVWSIPALLGGVFLGALLYGAWLEWRDDRRGLEAKDHHTYTAHIGGARGGFLAPEDMTEVGRAWTDVADDQRLNPRARHRADHWRI